MVSSSDSEDPKFNGSDWQALTRVVARARFRFAQDDDYDNNEERKCAYVAEQFTGPALDWVCVAHANSKALFTHFEGFVDATRQAFGIAENNLTALVRRDLDQLSWASDVPVFFAEFDRLTLALGITSDETKVAMLESKLPHHLKVKLSEQGLSFANYSTMRERFNLMWALDPTRSKTVTLGKKKPRCGSCGKKGHSAADCRSEKKN